MPSPEIRSAPKRSAEPPQSGESASEPLPEDPARRSVFDFLFHDARRVGSFLAQFETYGVPSQVKATEGIGSTGTTKTATSGKLSLPALAQGQLSKDVSVADELREATERTYDPLWTNARALLDYLSEQDLLQRDIWEARIGQFVLASGTLVILDLAMLKNAWDKPVIKRKIQQQEENAQFLLELLSIMPHSLQASRFGENFGVWCSLPEESLVGQSSDLVLKHGALVPGNWSMLGIVDATPDPKPGEGEGENMDDVVAREAGSMVGTFAAQLAPMTRDLLGRPRTSFGITPLLIFRQVSG